MDIVRKVRKRRDGYNKEIRRKESFWNHNSHIHAVGDSVAKKYIRELLGKDSSSRQTNRPIEVRVLVATTTE